MRQLHHILTFIIFVLISTSVSAQFYQGSYQEYGKNRVQYGGFSWKYHNYKRFKIHYSGGSNDLAIYTAKSLHEYLKLAEAKLDYTFPEKMEVIVFESQTKFRQSNLGLSENETSEIAGGSKIVGSKIFVYYPGNHNDYNKIIKGSVYEVLVKHMFFGGNWKNQLKSNLNSSLPSWLEQALINYLIEDWNPEIESRVKDLVLTKKLKKFNDLTSQEKIIAGQAMWYFIAENYGATTISNLISLTRITNNFERALNATINLDYIKLSKAYLSFYKKRYLAEYENQNEPIGEQISFKNKKESIYYSIKPSPDNEKLVYVENTLGRYRIKIFDKTTKKTTTVYRAESKMDRIQDYSYPVVEWHPNGNALAFYTERKGEVLFFIYSLNDKSLTEKVMKGVQKVLSFDYSKDGQQIVYSAVINGQTDLFLYTVSGGNKVQLTNDYYDDLSPRFVDDYHVVFSSNRDNDTISPIEPDIEFIDNNNDIFIYNLVQAKNTFKYLERITNTPNDNEIQPFATKSGKIEFLSDYNGIYNRFTSNKDSTIAFIDTIIHYNYSITPKPLTNSVTSIREHFINNTDFVTYSVYQNSKFKTFQVKNGEEKNDKFGLLTYKKSKQDRHKSLDQIMSSIDSQDTIYLNNVNYQKTIINIGDEADKTIKIDENGDTINTIVLKPKFVKPKYTMYKINFAKDFVLTQFDNNFLFPNYQQYSGPGSVYFNPGLNALLKIGASDLFDDYKLTGGLRIPTSLNSGGEQLLMVENLRNRTDHRLVYYRQKVINTNQLYKGITHDLRYRISYPFSEVLSLRTTLNVRQDKQVYIPYSDASLNIEPKFQHNTGLNVAMVFDNTIPMELNIRRGSRLKVFTEYLQTIENPKYTLNIGADLRHYTRIKRNFIWVNRLAGSTSLGTKKLLYYMGGVDNWVLRQNPDFNLDVDVDPTQNFGYQTIATPMRGFIQNTRNGNSFMLFTSELRLPIFTYFSSYPIKYEMLKHFQIVAFTDIGAAWTGASPLSPDNYFNTQIIEDYPVTISVQNLREPIIGSFGFGLRSKIYGYFVRLDVGWGVENLEIQKPVTQFSLSLDI